MRSDRNPYFILKNSKNPEIQRWLTQALDLTETEISQLALKPDLKKAMLFVKTFGEQNKSSSNAEMLAAMMCQHSSPSVPASKEIWQYNGNVCWVRCGRTSIEASSGDYFIKDHEKIFLKHNWINLAEPSAQAVVAESVFVELGDFNLLNHLIKTYRSSKYDNVLR